MFSSPYATDVIGADSSASATLTEPARPGADSRCQVETSLALSLVMRLPRIIAGDYSSQTELR